MDENTLIQLVYASSATIDFDKAALNGLLELARQNNGSHDITGILLYEKRAFFQVLEGNESTLVPLFEKISRDPRHAKVVKILQTHIDKRDFEDWKMGHADVTYSQLAKIEGLSDFFIGNRPLWEIEASRAKKLLEAFKQGSWRQVIR